MSTVGMKTNYWGPHAWAFLFSTIAGAFPVKIEKNNKDHKRIINSFKAQFTALKDTLPCVYCRNSFSIFLKELPIEDYIKSRNDMMYWLYLVHDKVNQKLIQQEKECYLREKLKLTEKYKNGKLSSMRYTAELLKLKSILITKPSPPFQKVLDHYEKFRAGCNPTTKRCA